MINENYLIEFDNKDFLDKVHKKDDITYKMPCSIENLDKKISGSVFVKQVVVFK